MLKNYVISLTTAHARREHIVQEFGKHNIPFSFFDALIPSNKLDTALQNYAPIIAPSSKLTSGEKACLMSHIALWEQCIVQNLPYIGIFEDDILLGKDAAIFMNSDNWLKNSPILNDAFILRLETFLMPVNLTKQTKLNKLNEYQFMLLDSVHFGTAGYIISQAAAKILLSIFHNLKDEDIAGVDIIMFDHQLKNKALSIYQLNPSICVQEQQYNQENSQLQSQLQEIREKNRQNNPELHTRRPLSQRLVRIFTKIHRKYKENRREVVPFK